MNKPNRGDLLRLGAGALAAAYGLEAPAAAATYKKPAGWDKLVEAANQEGSLVLYGPPTINGMYEALATRFMRAYPNIKVTGNFAFGNALLTRIQAERAGGRYLPDAIVIGSSVLLLGLKPSGALQPLEPLLMLPEILDPSAWFQNELWWTDAKRPNANYMFEGEMIPPAYYNTNLAKASDFHSYWDIADAKWKGKIAANDIRANGPGGVPARFIFNNSTLGRPWLERFFGRLDVRLSRDQRQLVDWLAQGQCAIAAFIDTDTAQVAIDQGLPIAPINISQLREGGAVAPDGGTVSVPDRVPHPNAAKLYVNWLLSRDGQTAWQEETKTPSLRTDLPKQDLHLMSAARKNYTFANGGAEKYVSTGTALAAAVTSILQSAGRS